MFITQIEKDYEFTVCLIESVGFLVEETSEVYVLAGDLVDEDIRRTLVIPKENVVSIEYEH